MSLRRMMLDKNPLKIKLFEGYGENKEEERRVQSEIKEKTKQPGPSPRSRKRIVGKQPPTEEAGRAESTEARRQRLRQRIKEREDKKAREDGCRGQQTSKQKRSKKSKASKAAELVKRACALRWRQAIKNKGGRAAGVPKNPCDKQRLPSLKKATPLVNKGSAFDLENRRHPTGGAGTPAGPA